ncbi:uncharacterized protein V6R79_023011 [Siganus canaliculatus]
MSGTRLFVSFFVLLSVTPAGVSDVDGHKPVQASAGEDVVLSCLLEPPFNVRDLTVNWKLDDDTVHLYKNGLDDPDDQLQQFSGRTSLFHSEMKVGNISLKLTNVTEKDSGVYICYVPRLQSQVKEGNISLTVLRVGGSNETQDDKKQSTVNWTSIIVAIVIVVVIVFVLLGLGWKRLKTWWNGCRRRWRRNEENHQQREEPETVALNHVTIIPQNGDPGADPGLAGQTLPLSQPGNTSGSPRKRTK